ncbi:MAG: amidase [Gammaproteobacteria bacterium]|nr:amidase [Gammaproteobacteria bacterium]|tara:strand:- start:65 stop:1504 length:1440 start_codon:yes stop_codon:yes gene_type:complete
MDVLYRSAFQLAAEIKAQTIKSRDLLEFYLDRVEKYNPALNSVVQLDLNRARKRADEADIAANKGEDWGPLHGLPLTIKDAYATEGIVSTNGIPDYKDFVPDFNADGVKRYVNAGAIVFGKTNVPYMSSDLQSYNDIYGTTNNPWDLSRTCGGSSGGAAASLAAGLTPLEFGSDIGGSIRTPANFNGVFGHKPTHGIVSQRGHLPMHESLAEGDLWVAGPLGISATDVAQAFDLLLGPPSDRAVGWRVDLPAARTTDIRELRVATYFTDPNCEVDSEIQDILASSAKSLEAEGANISWDVKPEIDFAENHLIYMQLLNSFLSIGMPEEQKEQMHKAVSSVDAPDELVNSPFMSHEQWTMLNERRLQLNSIWTDFFVDYDVLLAPVTPVPAFEHDHSDDMGQRVLTFNGQSRPYLDLLFWSGFSLSTFLPASVAPAGRTKGNLPVGVQIVGPYLEDRTPLAVAAMLERCHQSFEPPPGFE